MIMYQCIVSTLKQRKVHILLAGIAFLWTVTIRGVVHAEPLSAEETTSEPPAAGGENSETVWDKTKEVSGDAWDAWKAFFIAGFPVQKLAFLPAGSPQDVIPTLPHHAPQEIPIP